MLSINGYTIPLCLCCFLSSIYEVLWSFHSLLYCYDLPPFKSFEFELTNFCVEIVSSTQYTEHPAANYYKANCVTVIQTNTNMWSAGYTHTWILNWMVYENDFMWKRECLDIKCWTKIVTQSIIWDNAITYKLYIVQLIQRLLWFML